MHSLKLEMKTLYYHTGSGILTFGSWQDYTSYNQFSVLYVFMF